jgi:cytidylate kinase
MSNLIIAIDGYSSTGKSTFAKLISARSGLIYLDSGAMYRAVTLYALRKGIIDDEKKIDEEALKKALASDVEITFSRRDEGGFDIVLNGEDVEGVIRTLEVSNAVSFISALAFVRSFVDDILHRLGSDGCVMDGRDIGTAVFPNADLKLFMVAGAAIRAQRRLDEMTAKGESADFDEVLKNVLERDYIDSHREVHPLCQAEDAIVLDNSYLTVEQQMTWLSWILKNKFDIDF